MVKAVCGVLLKAGERSEDFILMFGVNETTDRLAMASSVSWYGHVLRRVDGHILRRVLELEVEAGWNKGRPRRTWKKQVKEEGMNVGLSREDAIC